MLRVAGWLLIPPRGVRREAGAFPKCPMASGNARLVELAAARQRGAARRRPLRRTFLRKSPIGPHSALTDARRLLRMCLGSGLLQRE